MPLSPEQLAMRKTGLGASDMAEVICGSAMRVYAQKTTDTPFQTTERMELGNQLEPIIAALYTRKYGVPLYRPNKTFRHPTEEWALATPDGLVMKGGKLLTDIDYGVEIKFVGRGMIHEWGKDGNDIPPRTMVQGLWSCDVVGVNRWDVGALLCFEDPYLVETGGGEKTLIVNGIVRFCTIKVSDNPVLMERVRELGRKFWFEHVVPNKAPRPDGRESTKDIIKLLHPDPATGDLEEATDEEVKLISEEAIAEARFKHYRQVYEQAKQSTDLAIGTRPGIFAAGVGRVTRKKDTRGAIRHNLKSAAPIGLLDIEKHPVKDWWED